MPPCPSCDQLTGASCEGTKGHAGMCGQGGLRWWGANVDPQAEHKPAKVGDDLGPPTGMPHWLSAFMAWVDSEDDNAPLDFQGAEVPPRVAMLLGRAFSDAGEWIGQRVGISTRDGQTVGELAAVYRDAAGAPYALRQLSESWMADGKVDPLIVPWPAVLGLNLAPEPKPAPGPDPWKPPQPGDADYAEPPF